MNLTCSIKVPALTKPSPKSLPINKIRLLLIYTQVMISPSILKTSSRSNRNSVSPRFQLFVHQSHRLLALCVNYPVLTRMPITRLFSHSIIMITYNVKIKFTLEPTHLTTKSPQTKLRLKLYHQRPISPLT